MNIPVNIPYVRSEIDLLVDHRLNKLEIIAEKLTENQVILIRIELNGQENSRALSEVKERVKHHGLVLDGLAREMENAKTQLDGLPEASELTAGLEKVKTHDKALVGTVALVMLAVGAKVLNLI